ncbi:tetratricopeptide repeat protein [Paraburkholderia phymatum]|uniref:tetratricopeptide repeat protein n=1 Tax=Paraburkholderia phymatum TaxID=148447 RepID=UPI003170E440
MNERQALLERALGHHQAGRLGQAQALYREILAQEPGQPDAQHFLGLLGCQLGQYDAGLALMEQSLAARREPAYLNNLGNMLREHGRLEEAIARYQEAVRLQVDYAEAHNNLGNALREAGRAQEAMYCCARAIELSPQSAQAYNNLGNALQDLGELDAAAVSYGKAIALAPGYAQAYSNLGNVQRARQQMDAAIGSYRQAIGLQPDLHVAHHGLGLALRATGDLAGAAASLLHGLDTTDPHAHNTLATALTDIGDLEGAQAHCRKALQLAPELAIAHSNLGGILRMLRRYDEAIASCRRALELDPRLAVAYVTLATACFDQEQFAAAEQAFRQAIALGAGDINVHHNLAVTLLRLEKTGEALASCREALSRDGATGLMLTTFGDILCASNRTDEGLAAYRRALELDPDLWFAHTSLLFKHAGWIHCDPVQMLADARRFGGSMTSAARRWEHAPASVLARPLRIGFVSGDLRGHPVAVFIEGLITAVNPDRVQLFAYATQPSEDHVTARLKPHFGVWRDISALSDEAAADLIGRDGIDVLLDLSGHTKHHRLPLFAGKPAPVQATWLGYFATTGIAEMDYVLGDAYVLPVDEEAHFTEKPWRLPDSYLCFTPPDEPVEVGPLPMAANGFITFGTLNNANKLNDEVIALWSRVLRAVPDSRLLLKSAQFAQPPFSDRIARALAARGVARDRLILLGHSYRRQHLEAFNLLDIALDPFPYPGGTTSVEGLWMGVPVLTRKGDRFLSHVGESILHTAGLPEWIARDNDDYVAKAVAFASDPAALADVRRGLRAQLLASPLCDARRFARNFEDAMAGMYASVATGAASRD